MIPPVVYEGCSSPGEVELFRRLRDDPMTGDWIVLHSLDIAEHRRRVSGEADFVVIVPGKGVLVVEVKASHSVSRDRDGQWRYGTNPKPDPRGPFGQAAEAMHSIREGLVKRNRGLSGVVFWSAVVFPRASFDAHSGEWHPWQSIDALSFRRRPIGSLLEGVLDRARAFLRERPSAGWFRPDSGEPDLRQCEAIAEALRPSFEFFESPKAMAQRREEELKRYTQEQAAALDAMEANRRVVFSGPAGTGKTLLAVETARRARAQGRRVLLVCYNRLLGTWMEEQAAELRPEVASGTLHSRMLLAAGLKRPPEASAQSFWETDLPLTAMERMLEDNREGGLFDELVVDEAQDILREEYLDFLDLSLRGGLAAGRWRVFGDFENQAVYGAASMKLDEFLATRAGGAPVYSLRTNCRNTPRVAEYAHLLGGLNPRYSRILRPDDDVRPVLRYYSDEADQRALAAETLGELYGEGFKGDDVVVLSTRADSASCAASISEAPWGGRLRPAWRAEGGRIPYCSIRRFKGMEAPAVLVTDVEKFGGPESTALFYVAVTRALQRLIILVHESAKESVRDRIVGAIAAQSGSVA